MNKILYVYSSDVLTNVKSERADTHTLSKFYNEQGQLSVNESYIYYFTLENITLWRLILVHCEGSSFFQEEFGNVRPQTLLFSLKITVKIWDCSHKEEVSMICKTLVNFSQALTSE